MIFFQTGQTMPASRNKFEETIEVLAEELALAMKWDRPSILLAVHKSKPSQRKAESPDAVQSILTSAANLDRDIFFISNIDQGGGDDGRNGYRALNLYRETIIENSIKIVFWLTTNEEIKLPKYAPDFWAFRHRVVQFSSTHQSDKISPPSGLLSWDMESYTGSSASLNEKIVSRKQLLGELPATPESLAMRIELLYALGYLYWALGDVFQARDQLILALELARRREYLHARSQLLNGLAILAYEADNYQEASNIYTELIEKEPANALFRMNLAVVLSALGKNYLAIAEVERALRIDPANAEIVFTSGYLYLAMGKFDDAIDLLKRSIQLAPATIKFHEVLSACYAKMGLVDEAREQVDHAGTLDGDRASYTRICKEVILGNLAGGESLLRAAIGIGKISKVDLLRDPTLNIIFESSLIQSIVG